MNKKHIQDLLDKYFEGESSLSEEMELKDFFLKTSILPDEWKAYKKLFTYFENESAKRMPVSKKAHHQKSFWWTIGLGLTTAATILLLFTIHLPTTQKELHPLAVITKQHDSMYGKSVSQKKSETKKSTKKEEPEKSKPARTIIGDHPSTILALKDEKVPNTNIDNTIKSSLAPLDKMDDINHALQKFRYFDLMNKYLPNLTVPIIKKDPKN
ncbi:MAG: hypothetical protein HXX14_02625 [Bacteroidetes bacterium]|nr:hypothetical protein [Bacteroidota bacterium]